MKQQSINKEINKLNKAEKIVLEIHKKPSTTSEILDKTRYSNSYITRIKRKLTSLELIEVTGREGNAFVYSLTDKGKEIATNITD